MTDLSKEQRRELMPVCTKWIDEMREAFGADQIVYIKASESGHSVEWRKG